MSRKKKIDVGKIKLSLKPLTIEEVFLKSLNFDLKEHLKKNGESVSKDEKGKKSE